MFAGPCLAQAMARRRASSFRSACLVLVGILSSSQLGCALLPALANRVFHIGRGNSRQPDPKAEPANILRIYLNSRDLAIIYAWRIDDRHRRIIGQGVHFGPTRQVVAKGDLTFAFAEIEKIVGVARRSDPSILSPTTLRWASSFAALGSVMFACSRIGNQTCDALPPRGGEWESKSPER